MELIREGDRYILLRSFATGLLIIATANPAIAQDNAANRVSAESSDDSIRGSVQDIIVTAQKREQRLLDVGMSVQALTADDLAKAGINAPEDLSKVVPGFTYNITSYGTPIYTIRGIGFQESTISAGPTVTTYIDEVPIPYTVMTLGVALDLGRLEVLKGPQGTLFGQNSTGGALNFVTARPTDTVEAGVDLEYSSFNTFQVGGFISGPLTSTLKARFSADYVNGDGWQESYTRRGEHNGAKDFLNGRLLLDWDPVDNFSVKINVSAWRDRGETAAPQFWGVNPLSANNPMLPGFVNYPRAPHNNRWADWTPSEDRSKNNDFWFGSLRMDYELSSAVTLTSLTAYQDYKRDELIEGDGTSFESYSAKQNGKIESFYQEFRASGDFGGQGNFVLGVNYGKDKTFDEFFQLFRESSSRTLFGLPFAKNGNFSQQEITTKAVFANVEYPIITDLTLQAGIRYTDVERSFEGCGRDTGDGQASAIFTLLRDTFRGLYGETDPLPPIPAGACYSLGAAPTFLPGLDVRKQGEDNISWRVGLNFKPSPETLIYANVSKGYKAGSFPTIASAAASQMSPVTQESVMAYEIGAKARAFDNRLELTTAAFYYDYKDKQIRGYVPDPVWSSLGQLVNIPKSRVWGFEASAIWQPWEGMILTPSISYTNSKIQEFVGYDYLARQRDFSGEPFPMAPKWQWRISAEQSVPVNNAWTFFAAMDVSYQDSTYTSFGREADLYVKDYTLLGLRAGIESEKWRATVWARNIFDSWYWNSSVRLQDSLVRYTGMPRTLGVSLSYRFQ